MAIEFNALITLDVVIAQYAVYWLLHHEALLRLVQWMATDLPYAIVPIGLVLFYRYPTHRPVLYLSIFAAVAGSLVSHELGSMFPRERPYTQGYVLNLMGHGSPYRSWPSTHATSLFAFATTLIIFRKTSRNAFLVIVLIASLNAIARVIAGTHFLSDVLSGLVLGSIIAGLCLWAWTLVGSYKTTNVTAFHAPWLDHPSIHAIAWLIVIAVSTLLWDGLAWDLSISRLFGTSQGFALAQHPIWGTGLYRLQRLLAWTSLLLVIWMCFRPAGAFTAMPRSERFFMLTTVLMALTTIQVLKRNSLTSCPWSLQEFGGGAQYVSHWMLGAGDGDGDSGHCFPAGHSSGALCFLAVSVFMLWHNKRWAYALLAVVLLAGGIWGGTQLIRGAHYVSHTLWTATICLAVALLLRAVWYGLERFRWHKAQA
jgi:membrane-associated PAP2 superfamily phosphatase